MSLPTSAQLEDRTASQADLKTEVLAWRKRMKKLLAVLNERNEEVLKLEVALRSERAVNQRLMESVDFANRQLEQLGSDLEELADELRVAREETAAARAEYAQASDEVDRLRDQNARLSAEQVSSGLEQIRGIGARLALQLSDLGVETVEDLASLDPDELHLESHPLHPFRGHATRYNWIGQAICLTESR